MKEIFDIKRFGKYFQFELRNGIANYGLSLLILGLMPLIMYVFYGLFHLIFSGGWVTEDMLIASRISAVIAALVSLMLTAPVKLFGSYTEKRAGSNFLMLPASVTEKFISMLLLIMVVVPVVFLALFIASDAITNLITLGSYSIPELNLNKIAGVEGFDFHMNFGLMSIGEWFETAIVFTLGALYFKSGKVAKTFLVMILIGMAFSLLSSFAMTVIGFDNITNFFENLEFESLDGQKAYNTIVGIGTAINAVVDIALAAWLFIRLKTMKH